MLQNAYPRDKGVFLPTRERLITVSYLDYFPIGTWRRGRGRGRARLSWELTSAAGAPPQPRRGTLWHSQWQWGIAVHNKVCQSGGERRRGTA